MYGVRVHVCVELHVCMCMRALCIVDIQMYILMHTLCACVKEVVFLLHVTFIQPYIHKMFGKCSELASPPGSSQHLQRTSLVLRILPAFTLH